MDKIDFKCQDCGHTFKAEQGSRRKYCTRCGNKRLQAGRRRKPTKPVTA